MISQELELNIVLIGWVIPILLGLVLLVIKTPETQSHIYYQKGKLTCAIAFLLFGVEILSQWVMRVLEVGDPILSVSVYLLVFCLATLLFAMGYCTMISPGSVDRRQQVIAAVVLLAFVTILVINYFLPNRLWQVRGLLLCCVFLFIITCSSIYSCVAVYRKAINNLRTYYSDVVENMIRWMPGVGAGILVFLLSAPFVCWLPRWVGVYQVALGIIMIIYTFICIINFSSSYKSLAAALNDGEDGSDAQEISAMNDAGDEEGDMNVQRSSFSDSLIEVMQEKEARWRARGGYRTKGVTIEQAAREIGTNRSYLSKYLNEVRQMTFYEWVAQMRIQEAQSLMLADRNMPIEQIANEVGFTSQSTFSSTFKKQVGISPNAWRNQQL